MKGIKKMWAWIRRNENHLSTLTFLGGTGLDLWKLSTVTLSYGILLFAGYMIVIVLTAVAEHYLYLHEATEGAFLRNLRLVLAFVAEFVTGAFLSGLFVFYTRSASLGASWPYLLVLVAILFGNEFLLRGRHERLVFRCGLFFFALYAYVIFVFPILMHHIGEYTFLESTVIAVIAFILFLGVLALLGWRRLKESLGEIVIATLIIIGFVGISYFSGIIPPIPLALRDAGVYHSITPTVDASGDSVYEVQAETSTDPWWDFLHLIPTTVHVAPGAPLSVYSAVFAPTALTTAVVHRWEWYNTKTHTWVTLAEIAFPIDGGRDGGYRGYSTLSNLVPGKYRVLIELISGQVIGQLNFTVESATTEPITYTIDK